MCVFVWQRAERLVALGATFAYRLVLRHPPSSRQGREWISITTVPARFWGFGLGLVYSAQAPVCAMYRTKHTHTHREICNQHGCRQLTPMERAPAGESIEHPFLPKPEHSLCVDILRDKMNFPVIWSAGENSARPSTCKLVACPPHP